MPRRRRRSRTMSRSPIRARDTLYVPATQLDLISKYIGGGEDTAGQAQQARRRPVAEGQGPARRPRPRILPPGLSSSMPSASAARATPSRPTRRGRRSSRRALNTPKRTISCAASTRSRRDMESPAPMDRLLCGDVGFGKTEVALRAAMKCILDGKQVAILVPTTVLAQQHYVTAPQPLRPASRCTIGVLSRFRTPAAADARRCTTCAPASSTSSSARTSCCRRTSRFKDLGLLDRGRGAALRRDAQGKAQGAFPRRRRADACPQRPSRARSTWRCPACATCPPLRSRRTDRYPVQTFVLEHDRDAAARRHPARAGARRSGVSICTTA